jgi:hypothetical protein
MTKAKITDYSVTAASNTDVQDISLAEGWLPATVNNMFRAFLAHVANASTGVSGWLTLQNTITAGTTQTQAGATAITGPLARVTTCANANDGVKLPTCAAEVMITVMNLGATNLQVWPNTSDTVNGGSADAVDAYVVPPNTSRTYLGLDATDWRAVPFNGGVTGSPVQTATSGVIETDGTYVAVCKFGPALDGVNWDEKTSAPTAKVMLATIKDAGADTTVQIWSGTVTPIAASVALGSVTLTGAATPTSIAGAGGILIIGCEDGVRFVGIVNNAWAELTTGWPRALSTTTTPALTNNDVQSVAATLYNGLTYFGVAYGTGADVVSLIKPEGVVYDRAGTVGNPLVAFSDGLIAYGDNNSGDAVRMSGAPVDQVTADFGAHGNVLGGSDNIPPSLGIHTALAASGSTMAGAGTTGLSLAQIVRSSATNYDNTAGAAITRTYNTGYMVGDIRGAWLANSVTADRSYKANTLTQNGTVTEAVVETSAELKGYSGFSASNNLSRASDADWDVVGTGTIYLSCWFKSSGNSAQEYFINFGNSGATVECILLWDSSGRVEARDDGATAQVNFATTDSFDDGVWHKADFVRVSSTERYLYVDGVLKNSSTTDAGSLSDSGNLPLYIGVLAADGSSGPADDTTLSLAKISATAPTATQIRQMYEAEKPMFVASAKCLLQSATTDAVLDVDIDAITGFVTVVQTDDETVWKGLAIHSEPTIPTGGTTWEHSVRHAGAAFTITDANFAGNVPAIAVRDVASDVQGLMAKLPAGVDLGKAKAWVIFNGSGTIAINASYNVKSLTDNGTGDYLVNWAVPFKSAAYVVQVTARAGAPIFNGGSALTTGSVSVAVETHTGARSDSTIICVSAFGELENE